MKLALPLTWRSIYFAFVIGLVASYACGSSNGAPTTTTSSTGSGGFGGAGGGGTGGFGGGAAAGPKDMHCAGITPQATSQAACTVTPDGGDGGTGAGGAGGGGAGGGGGGGGSPYGATMYRTQGDDDDCKYNLVWSVANMGLDRTVTFTVAVTSLTTGAPVTGASTIIEAFISRTHPAPNSNPTTTENPPGTYVIGPIEFDLPGRWTVRFHLFEECTDALPASPHGQAAFYVTVP